MRTGSALRGLAAILAVVGVPCLIHAESFSAVKLEQYIESLRQQAGIPGLSAAIVQNGVLAWERGFGEVDLDRKLPARPDTPYPIAGLTGSLNAVQLLQCAERGLVSLDAPIGNFYPGFGDPGARLRDVMAHVTGARRFALDPAHYDAVAAGIKACNAMPLRSALETSIFQFLAMRRSVPGHDFATWSPGTVAQFAPGTIARYASVMADLARPYRANGRSKPTASNAAAAGLTGFSGAVSTVQDLARFQGALDTGLLLRAETLQAAWTPPLLGDGRPSPHALGWFVQTYEGQLIVWQFGIVPEAYSSLIMTLPQRGVTLILLANSDGLVEPFGLTSGDISTSPFARLFLRLF